MACDNDYTDVGVLIDFDGTNGQATFTDTGPNAITVSSVNGGAVSTSSPEYGTGCLGLIFQASPSGAAVNVPITTGGPVDIFPDAAGDFTIEVGFRLDTLGDSHPLIIFDYGNAASMEASLSASQTGGAGSGALTFDPSNLGFSGGSIGVSGLTYTSGAWNQAAIVRSAGTGYLFLNGTLVATTGAGAWTGYTNPGSGSPGIAIGWSQRISTFTIAGAIDNFRVTKGVARYTTSYTAPTAAFPASQCAPPPPCNPDFGSVVLQLAMDGANNSPVFIDSSSVGNTVTPFGGAVQTTGFTPEFGTSCGDIFAGSGLTMPLTAGGPLDLHNSTFTIDGWINLTSYVSEGIILSDWSNFPGTELIKFYVNGTGGGQLVLQANGTGANYFINTVNAVPLSTWVHVAAVVDLATSLCDVWLNGVCPASSGCAAFANPNPQTTMYVGEDSSTAIQGNKFDGFMQYLRVTKGLALYTPGINFTPPTMPPGAACPVTVPNVVGFNLSVASALITGAFLVVGAVTTDTDPTVPAGDIISQDPAAGTPADIGASVDLVVSLGPAGTVPDVVNTSISVVAPAILAGAGFVVGTVGFAPNALIIAGNVISQSPAAGTSLATGEPVNLIVSSGLPPLTIPDLFGLDEADARLALTSLGLVVGAVGTAPSRFVAPGTVMTQNGSPGTPVASGTVVSFVLSTGTPLAGIKFDFEATVISQYANSPVILQLASNMNDYVDQSTNFANFFNYVWNVLTAVGFGLDIWGRIVGVSRLLHIPTTSDYVGFDNSATPPPDWQTMGSNQPPQPAVGDQMYTGYNATQTYLLLDDAYRQLILAKAFANICTTTAPAINTILQNLYGKGSAWVLNTGVMTIEYHLNFVPSAIQLAILEQSGVIPTPPGVLDTIVPL